MYTRKSIILSSFLINYGTLGDYKWGRRNRTNVNVNEFPYALDNVSPCQLNVMRNLV